ncbi:MAG: phosphatidylglycerophosphatase A [Rhodospirillaceae bacterium]|jgi:phosphatidylglycerophosphatase A|nr:phosphatidylglycerophosphatase A [Rhodospirillaceae bacterium]MBT6137141.1 phosphatidylglycerophosphatase A [Rhodospirillaceae bacterium]
MMGLTGWLATWFGCGLSPKAPGTMGSLAALPFAYGMVWAWGMPGLLIAIVIIIPLGIWACERYAQSSGDPDPGSAVIDEVAGQWIALVPAGLDPILFAVAFVSFRLFDIWKPGPIGVADRELKGGLGIMVDDLLAGLPAAAIVWAAGRWLI